MAESLEHALYSHDRAMCASPAASNCLCVATPHPSIVVKLSWLSWFFREEVRMLRVRRARNESISIETPGGVITVVVVALDKRYVELGIDAPPEYAIVRDNARPRLNQ